MTGQVAIVFQKTFKTKPGTHSLERLCEGQKTTYQKQSSSDTGVLVGMTVRWRVRCSRNEEVLCLCRPRDVLMEKGVGKKLLRALRLNEVGGECPERKVESVRFNFKCPRADLLKSFYWWRKGKSRKEIWPHFWSFSFASVCFLSCQKGMNLKDNSE